LTVFDFNAVGHPNREFGWQGHRRSPITIQGLPDFGFGYFLYFTHSFGEISQFNLLVGTHYVLQHSLWIGIIHVSWIAKALDGDVTIFLARIRDHV